MRTIFKFFLFCFAAFCASCEDVVQIKLDEGSKLFVIDAFITNMPGTQIIRVTTNDTYFSDRVAPPVASAMVVVKDLTDNSIYNFSYANDGNYFFVPGPNDTLAKTNHQYELNVTINGVTYTSLTTQKRAASIDSISATLFTGEGGFGGPPEDPFFFCELFAKDKCDAIADYYWVKTFRNDSLQGMPSLNLAIDGTGGEVKGVDVDSLPFTAPATFLGFATFNHGSKVRVEIHSITKESYDFLVQATIQINNGGLFATTPENVKSNITTPVGAPVKAIGWFNVASVAIKEKLIP